MNTMLRCHGKRGKGKKGYRHIAFALSAVTALALLAGSILSPVPSQAQIAQGDIGISANDFLIKEDSSESTTWTIGGPAAKTDFDTSVVFEIYKWDILSLEAKFRTQKLYDIDSADVGIIWQVSNDQTWWHQLDSLNTTDSLANFKAIDMRASKWKYGRFVVHHGDVTADSGSTGTIRALRWGIQ